LTNRRTTQSVDFYIKKRIDFSMRFFYGKMCFCAHKTTFALRGIIRNFFFIKG
jgi:hypothetical protein